jgi:hypothetical protein
MSFPVSNVYINQRCGLHLDEYQKNNPDPDKADELGIINGKGKFTACCKTHTHINRAKYEEVVPLIIDEFIKAGFKNTMINFQTKYDILNVYDHLSKDICHVDHITGQKAGYSNRIIKQYMPHIYDVRDYKNNNIESSWTKENLIKAFKQLDKPNNTVNSHMSELLKKLKFTPVTVYSPLMTKRILETLDCKTILDPCIGWGGRMLGTTCIGGEYTGCEPFTETFKQLKCMETDLKLSDNVTLFNMGAEEMIDILKDTTQEWDACLTSPPYYDLEVYSDEDTQSIKLYKTYEEWLNKFIDPIIEFVCKRVTKYSCWSVKNFKTDKKYDLLDDVISIHKKYGWELSRQFAIKKNTNKKITTEGDVTYVFNKYD